MKKRRQKNGKETNLTDQPILSRLSVALSFSYFFRPEGQGGSDRYLIFNPANVGH